MHFFFFKSKFGYGRAMVKAMAMVKVNCMLGTAPIISTHSFFYHLDFVILHLLIYKNNIYPNFKKDHLFPQNFIHVKS